MLWGYTQVMSEHKLIPLQRKTGPVLGHAKVDEADYVWISQHRWSILNKKGYVYRGEWNGGKPRLILLSRAIMGLKVGDPGTVDHINRDPFDNRRKNLRVIPHGAQSQNRGSRPGTTSTHRGVYWHKPKGRWVAKVAGKWLGAFDTEEAAAKAAREYRLASMPYAVD